MSEPREWTLCGPDSQEDASGVIDGPQLGQYEEVRVVESSALDALRAERDKLREALERIYRLDSPVRGLGDERRGHDVAIAAVALGAPPLDSDPVEYGRHVAHMRAALAASKEAADGN